MKVYSSQIRVNKAGSDEGTWIVVEIFSCYISPNVSILGYKGLFDGLKTGIRNSKYKHFVVGGDMNHIFGVIYLVF